MSTIFHQAIRLNNDGIKALREGKPESAIHLLSNAVQLLKGRLSLFSNDASSSSSEGPCHRVRGMNTVPISYAQPLENTTVPNIFNRAFVIRQTQSSIEEEPSCQQQCEQELSHLEEGACVRICVSAVIFNLALAYHISISCCSSRLLPSSIRKGMVSKTERFYSMVIAFLAGSQYSLGSTHIGSTIRLACIYNLCQILITVRGLVEAARRCLVEQIILVYGGGRQRESSALPASSAFSIAQQDLRCLIMTLVLQLDASQRAAASAA